MDSVYYAAPHERRRDLPAAIYLHIPVVSLYCCQRIECVQGGAVARATDDNNTGRTMNDARNELSVQTLSSSKSTTTAKPARKHKPWRLKFVFSAVAAGALALGGYIYDELAVSSTLQSRFFKKLHDGEIFTKIVTTPPPAIGNTDVERGYNEIQRIRKETLASGGKVSPQLPWKDRQVGPLQLAPLFDRKPQTGITILDVNNEKMYSGDTPHDIYKTYEEIPAVIVQSLCIVEDRNICDQEKAPTFNAAINWWRAIQAAIMGVGKKLNMTSKVEGGSTLPIQITKNDSWERGRTRGFLDKAEQMLTASAEMYALGHDTRQQRLNKIVEYINTASFAGHPQFGEIKGIKDAMAVLYGSSDYDEKLHRMNEDEETALAFRQMFSLVMAVKMPDESLRSAKGYEALQGRIDNFTKMLVDEKIITPSFAQKVKAVRIDFSEVGKNPALTEKPRHDKSVNSMRLSVMNKLNLSPIDGMYKLDRWDIRVDSTLDHAVNTAVNAKLKSFNDPEIAKQNGLIGFQLLRPETAPKVTWAITVNERLPDGRVVTRVSTDTFKGSLDLTKGGRQNYGSTSKMRMAVTFLEVIAELHDKYAAMSPEDLKAIQIHARDKLSRWAVDYLSAPENDHALEAMQRAAISTIKYSGHRQGFFTGGGMNYPGNFDRREDHQSYSVEEALWESVNLSWYRITDDIEEYMKWGRLNIDPAILDDREFTDEQLQERRKYLHEFADFEGRVFSGRFWRQQKARIASELADNLARKDENHKVNMTGLYRGFYPESSFEEYARFMNEFCKNSSDKNELRSLFDDNKKKSKSSAAPLLALHTDGSVESLVRLYRYTTPHATYDQTKAFILSLNKDLGLDRPKDSDFSREYNEYESPVTQAVLDLLTEKAKGVKTRLAVVYTTLHPDAPFEDFEAYMLKECKTCDLKDDLFKLYHEHKPERLIDTQALLYKFDLNDRGYLTRPIHPLELAIAAARIRNPDITWKEIIDKTYEERIHVYKWLIHSKKKKAQARAIGTMLDHHAWREISRQWQSVGYPFRLVPSLATVIGVSGDTTESLATLNSIFLNGGKSVTTTRISRIHLGVGTPHETHIEPGQPAQKQVMRESTARLMLEMTRGVVASERGTGRRIKDGFMLSDGRALELRGKTGTNDESGTSGIRVGAFAGTMGDRYSVSISGYITGATASDKFTSGMAVQALKMLLPELRPLSDHAYGVTPETIAAYKAGKSAVTYARQRKPLLEIGNAMTGEFTVSSATIPKPDQRKPNIHIVQPMVKPVIPATAMPK